MQVTHIMPPKTEATTASLMITALVKVPIQIITWRMEWLCRH